MKKGTMLFIVMIVVLLVGLYVIDYTLDNDDNGGGPDTTVVDPW